MKVHGLSTMPLIVLLAIGLLTAIAVAGEPVEAIDPEGAAAVPPAVQVPEAVQPGDAGTYTGVMTATCWTVMTEDFEGAFPPANWTVIDNGGDCGWQRNDAFATARPNYAGGEGYCADADSEKCGSGTTMNTELRTMALDLSAATTATLKYVTAYLDIGTSGDYADVDASIDGGASWTNLLHWDDDHSPYGPGEAVTLDLTQFQGEPSVMIRFHYWIATWDYWWEVDQVQVEACYIPDAAPEIAVDPISLTQTLEVNQTAAQTFNIANVGLGILNWSLGEGCGTPVGWLSETPTSGTLNAYNDIDVETTFDSTGLALGTYQTTVCVNSNDFDEPSIPVDVTLIVTGTPEIDVTPISRETTLCQGETDTQYLSICNVSTGPLEWSLSEVGEGLTAMGYALDLSPMPNNIVTFALNDFTGQTVVGPTSYDYFGMDFDPSGTVLYALNDTTDQLGTIDLTTGAFTGLAPCPPGGGAGYWTGMAIDPQSGKFYASTTTELFEINPTTGNSTLVGAFGAATTMVAIAVNAEGQMYGHDIGTDKIYQINTATGAATEVGPTGYLANFAQGMDFDSDDGTLYIWLYLGAGANIYGTVNLTTGAVTPLAISAPLGEFEGATQTTAIPPDIPWVTEAPTNGLIMPGECVSVAVTFEPGSLPDGAYTGGLLIESNDADEPEITIPVTLTVGCADIVVSPPSLEAALCPDVTDTRSMTICNGGIIPLDWEMTEEPPELLGGKAGWALRLPFIVEGSGVFSDIPWLSEDPISGTVPINQCVAVDVTFDSTGPEPGVYNAGLVITSNDPDTPEVTVPATMTVLAPAAIADVTYTVTSTQVVFDATASGEAPLAYAWTFGDGGTSSLQDPTHVYALTGCYTPTLTVSNECDQDTWQEQICVCEAVAGADFDWAPPAPGVGRPISFTGSITAGSPPLVWQWDFDDGATGDGQSVLHAFTTADDHLITMTVTNGCGQMLVEHTVTVRYYYYYYLPVIARNYTP